MFFDIGKVARPFFREADPTFHLMQVLLMFHASSDLEGIICRCSSQHYHCKCKTSLTHPNPALNWALL